MYYFMQDKEIIYMNGNLNLYLDMLNNCYYMDNIYHQIMIGIG